MPPRATQYAAILDAGSSGTRFYLYRWKEWNVEDSSPPHIEDIFSYKDSAQPGISTLRGTTLEDLEGKVNKYFQDTLQRARDFCAAILVPPSAVPLWLYATAGMRQLENSDLTTYTALVSCIRKTLQGSRFGYRESGAITGQAEALFGWTAANYTLGSFSGYGLRSSQTVGYVEMGGASTQIAFPLYPGANGGLDEYPDDGRIAKITIGQLEFDMVLASHSLGLDVALRKYQQNLVAGKLTSRVVNSKGVSMICDPSRNLHWEGLINVPAAGGQGTPARGAMNLKVLRSAASEALRNLIEKHEGDDPRIEGHLVQTVRSRPFVGGANFWYSTRTIFGKYLDGKPKKTAFSFEEYREEIECVSQMTWETVNKLHPDPKGKPFWENACFSATWVQCVLSEFYCLRGVNHREEENEDGNEIVPEDRLSFRPYNGSNGVELSWTLGFVVLHSTQANLRIMNAADVRSVNFNRKLATNKETDAQKLSEKGAREWFTAFSFLEQTMWMGQPQDVDEVAMIEDVMDHYHVKDPAAATEAAIAACAHGEQLRDEANRWKEEARLQRAAAEKIISAAPELVLLVE